MLMYAMWSILLLSCCEVDSLKCYQCSSMRDRGCFDYSLDSKNLLECPDRPRQPVCRSISQVQYFTPNQDVTIVRECAYVYEEPLGCVQSKFSGLHYSLYCECREDGCNAASNGCVCRLLFFICAFVSFKL